MTVKKEHRTTQILGLTLFSKDMASLLEILQDHLSEKNELLTLFTPNAEQLAQSSQNPNFKQHLQQAELLIPDGFSLVLASRLFSAIQQKPKIKERIAGIDLAQVLITSPLFLKETTLIIGGNNYDVLVKDTVCLNPTLNFWQLAENLYWSPGFADKEKPTQDEEAQLAEILAELQPSIVMVALGAPSQEKWIIERRALLEKNQVRLALAVGGAFDVIFGKLQRAPILMQKIGLEWLFRLAQEPWRFKRQLRLFMFWWLVIKELFRKH